MTQFEKLYGRIFNALLNYPDLVEHEDPPEPPDEDPITVAGLVPVANVHPSDDPLDPVPGMSIIYSMSASFEDLKAKRFEGTIQVTTGSPKSKLDAHEIMASVRRALVPRALTGDGLVIALFKEQNVATDAGKVNESWRVITSFQFKMVEGSI